MDTETDQEFWNSLELISTAPDGFSDVLTSYLKSRAGDNNPSAGPSHIKGHQGCDVQEVRSLPITTIISRIQAEESDSEDNEVDELVTARPPPSHTGGKWKPGVSNNKHEAAESRHTVLYHGHSPETFDKKPNQPVVTTDIDDEDIEEQAIPDLQCPICNKIFTRTENIVVHLTSQKHKSKITKENQLLAAQLYTKYHSELLKRAAFQCGCCSFAAIRHEDLVVHLKSQQHTESIAKLVGPLECVQCSFLDYSGTDMLQHCLTHVNVSTVVLKEKRHRIKCQKCPQILHSTLHYSRHLKQQHSKTQDNDVHLKQCDYCLFKGKRTTVNEHISRTHRSHRPYLCKACDGDFHAKYDLAKHLSTKKHIERVLDNFKPVYRETNQTDSGNDNSMMSGRISHTNATMRCKFCPFQTSDIASLQEHYVSHHEESCPLAEDQPSSGTHQGVPLFCRFCHQQILLRSSLYEHEVMHLVQTRLSDRGNDDGDTECIICYATVNAQELSEHVKTHNPYLKSKVVKAGRESSNPSASATAARPSVTQAPATAARPSVTQAPAERFHCDEPNCAKSYKTKGDLNVHRKTHSGESQFECDVCSKKFPTKKQLKAHSLTHSSVMRYSCDYCNYKCKTKCHLQRHMRIHAGSKPYSCPYCEYSSTTIGNLRKHVLHTDKHKHLPMYECTESGCHFVSDTVTQVSQHLTQTHGIIDNKLMVKSTQNDWTDVIEGHSIIPAQH